MVMMMAKIDLERYNRGQALLESYKKIPKESLVKQLMMNF